MSSRAAEAAILVLASIAAVLISAELASQEVRRPTGRMVPGIATETPTTTPTSTPTTTATATPTATPTEDPDPCADCPEPGGIICELWPDACYQCWEDCGSPIATHTPTPPPTPTRTPTPPPTPTPQGPACELALPAGATVYLVAFYAHESSTQGTRYTFQTGPASIPPGSTVRPCPCQGHPIGFEWRAVAGDLLLKTCGDTSTQHQHIFSDGFETGNLGAWSSTNQNRLEPTP